MRENFWQDGGEEREKMQEERLRADLQWLAGQAQGRRFLKYLFGVSGIFEAMPVGNHDMYAYCEGRRSMGLMLYHAVYALGAEHIIKIQGEE